MPVQIYAFIAVLAAFAIMMTIDVIAQQSGQGRSYAHTRRRH
ncbi:MAG: hypothetical protein ACRDQZ_03370 [Mycobacteriales bacterium]